MKFPTHLHGDVKCCLRLQESLPGQQSALWSQPDRFKQKTTAFTEKQRSSI